MDVNQEEITVLYKEIYKLLMDRDFSAIDEKYRTFGVKSLNMVLLVGLPRMTYSYRDQMKEWVPFLQRCKEEIEERGEHPEELLKGLFDD